MFSNKKVRPVDSLEQSSKDILSIFTKVKEELQTVNESVQQQQSINEAEIDKLTNENERLGLLKTQHTNVIEKIENILN